MVGLYQLNILTNENLIFKKVLNRIQKIISIINYQDLFL